MRRIAATLGALACALVLPAGAIAKPAASSRIHMATGTVTATGWASLTIQTAGRRMGVINALTATATAVTQQDYPYVWAGGHAEAGVASVGSKGPGYTGHTRGYDCSGSVAAVLAGAGLWPAGSAVPGDAWVIRELLAQGIIARGAGTPPDEVTLYDDPGVHIFMNIDGRFFGTSDGGGGGSRKGGAGWLDDGAPDASTRVFKQYHVLPSVLRDRTTYGHSLSFLTGAAGQLAAGVQVGDKLHVGYTETNSGTMTLQALTFVGSTTTSGTVTTVATDGSSFAIQTPGGQSTTFSTGSLPSLTNGLQVADQVQVTYTKRAGLLTARAVSVTAPAPTSQPPVSSQPAATPPTGGPAVVVDLAARARANQGDLAPRARLNPIDHDGRRETEAAHPADHGGPRRVGGGPADAAQAGGRSGVRRGRALLQQRGDQRADRRGASGTCHAADEPGSRRQHDRSATRQAVVRPWAGPGVDAARDRLGGQARRALLKAPDPPDVPERRLLRQRGLGGAAGRRGLLPLSQLVVNHYLTRSEATAAFNTRLPLS